MNTPRTIARKLEIGEGELNERVQQSYLNSLNGNMNICKKKKCQYNNCAGGTIVVR